VSRKRLRTGQTRSVFPPNTFQLQQLASQEDNQESLMIFQLLFKPMQNFGIYNNLKQRLLTACYGFAWQGLVVGGLQGWLL